MASQIKWIVPGLVLLGITALFIWSDRIQPGSVFAGLATFIAAIKSKLFGNDKLAEKITNLKSSHTRKREEWENEKELYALWYDNLEERLDTLNRKIGILDKEIEDASKSNGKSPLRSEEEIRRWLRENSN